MFWYGLVIGYCVGALIGAVGISVFAAGGRDADA